MDRALIPSGTADFDRILAEPDPPLALAPMQDVTDLPFWQVILRYGGADLYFTEYFRVHADSNLEGWIVKAVRENPTGRPVIAQMIGNHIPSLVRTARALSALPIAGIDLNLGCPAPVVYNKCAGGGLLRDLALVDRILGALRDAIPGRFTVKTRIGFEEPVLDSLLPIFARHSLDLLTVHGRTVKEMYRGGVDLAGIARAAQAVPCPVLANGNVASAAGALETLAKTGVRGLMIGRGAIRNPWIFQQIRDLRQGRTPVLPTGREVLEYIRLLYETTAAPGTREVPQVHRMKKFMNYLGEGVDREGQFLHRIRRVGSRADFFAVCEEFLGHDQPMALEPIAGAAAG